MVVSLVCAIGRDDCAVGIDVCAECVDACDTGQDTGDNVIDVWDGRVDFCDKSKAAQTICGFVCASGTVHGTFWLDDQVQKQVPNGKMHEFTGIAWLALLGMPWCIIGYCLHKVL